MNYRIILLLTSMLVSPLSFAATYTYDSLHRLTSVLYDSGDLTVYSYDAGGNILSVITSADTDGDGVIDPQDAFPNDPAASVDTDNDGSPDVWNVNASAAQIAASLLTLDLFPNDMTKSSNKIAPQVSAGFAFSIALKSDGSLLAWGDNWAGQLGDGSTILRHNPVIVKDSAGNPIVNISSISAYNDHVIALKFDGTLLTWGDNSSGQLGDGTTVQRNNPVIVRDSTGNPITGIMSIAAGGSHMIALKVDGSLLAWGDNGAGQLGDGTTVQRNKPVVVKNSAGDPVTNIIAIAAGGGHSVALKSDGTLLSWGNNSFGQLGIGLSGSWTNTTNPVVITDNVGKQVAGISSVSASGGFTVALKSDGTLLAWGNNVAGQLGDGTIVQRNNPVIVRDGIGNPIMGIRSIAAGQQHMVALKSDGTLLSWGYNSSGQLGDGTTIQHNNPAIISGGAGNPLASIRSVATGGNHTVAIKNDSSLLAWGRNWSGQLGDGTTVSQANPVVVRDASGQVIQIWSQVNAVGVTQTFNLSEGWNLVSFPMRLGSNGITTFINAVNNVGGQVEAIWAYGSTSIMGGLWRSYMASTPSIANLKLLAPGMGYWVKLPNGTGNVHMTLTGLTPTQVTASLVPGWNLIGVIKPVTDVGNYLANGGASSVWTFQNGMWRSYVSNTPTFLNSLQKMDVGIGYYVLMQ